jgi:RimJ/RimL family protein N-acetyltransferase
MATTSRPDPGLPGQSRIGSLQGEKVYLRPPSTEDTSLLFDWLNDPEVISPFDRFEVESFRSMEEAIHRSSEDPQSLAPRFLIIRRKGDVPIGVVGYFKSNTALDTIDVWYVVTVEGERGRGYGHEAVRLLVDYLFAHFRVERVGATSDIDNPASRALVRSLGFREEGKLRRALFHHGEVHDVVVYGITRSEWGDSKHRRR